MNDLSRMTGDTATLAHHYADRGLPVFPCHPKTKRPLTDHGFKDATTDREKVGAFWAKHPRALIGIATGKSSGIFVLDLDTDDATGEAVGEAWLASVGLTQLLNGPGAITPSGGRHIYFRADGLAEGLTNSQGKLAPKVDTRGNGGYIIAPGSERADGAYRPVNGGLDASSLPWLPEGLLAALRGKSQAVLKAQAFTGDNEAAQPFFDVTKSASLAEAQEMLSYISPNCTYGEWVSVLMGLHEHFRASHTALRLAESWSSQGATYKPGEVAVKWRGFTLGKGTGWASVCKLARNNGANLSEIVRRHTGGAVNLRENSVTTSESALSFAQDWPEPEARYLRPELPVPPALPLAEVFGPRWAEWIVGAAEAKSAPPDYIAAALLSVAGATIGNTRWASPWAGWAEPPIIWAMAVGTPSMNKSPGFDAVLGPLRKLEGLARKESEGAVAEWRNRSELAKLAETAWKEAAKSSMKNGEDPPAKPKEADPGLEPIRPRYVLTDATVEKLGVILAGQPRGAFVFRDELAGWLHGMTRYSGGGSDRPFWLEAYGGRGFSVERLGREPVYVDHLSVGVLGGIQPDRLKSLVFKSDDDGLLARFLPVWPSAAPIRRPDAGVDDAFLTTSLERLLALQMPFNEEGLPHPWFVPFAADAADLFQDYREAVREWETGAEGLLLSFIGKLPGLAARVALVLAFLDYAATGEEAPQAIGIEDIGRATNFVKVYVLPMARRAYADASIPKVERAACRLASLLLARKCQNFSTREILKLEREGLRTKAALDPALVLLEEAGIVRRVEVNSGPKGGAPQRLYAVNPAIWGRE